MESEEFCWPESPLLLLSRGRSFNAVEINRSLPLFLVLINIFKRTGEIFFSAYSFYFEAENEKRSTTISWKEEERKRTGRAHLPQLGARPFAPTHAPGQYLDGNTIVIWSETGGDTAHASRSNGMQHALVVLRFASTWPQLRNAARTIMLFGISRENLLINGRGVSSTPSIEGWNDDPWGEKSRNERCVSIFAANVRGN